MPDIMNERRREKRRDGVHETAVSVVSAVNRLPDERYFYDYCEDVSAAGARIHAHNLLPVDTLLEMNIKFENMQQMMTTMAKVKWSRVDHRDESCEAGVEFCSPGEVTAMHMMPLLYLYSEELKYLCM